MVAVAEVRTLLPPPPSPPPQPPSPTAHLMQLIFQGRRRGNSILSRRRTHNGIQTNIMGIATKDLNH
ncbi:hypothetical protein ACE6H2_019458 [Prunus campanulata]